MNKFDNNSLFFLDEQHLKCITSSDVSLTLVQNLY